MRKLSLTFSFFTLFILALTHTGAFGQQYSFINYNVEDGLAQSQVNSICQDDEGYLWFATSAGGVSKFDGNQFNNFSRDDGLLNNQVNDIYKDSRGNLWFAFYEGISRYTGKEFINFKIVSPDSSGVYVNDITEDSNGNLLLSTSNGICLFDGKDYKFITGQQELVGNFFRTSFIDSKDRIWISSLMGIFTLINGQINQDSVYTSFGPHVNTIIEDKSNKIWLGTIGQGIFLVDGKNVSQITTKQGLLSDFVRKLYLDNEGNIWIIYNEGISKYDGSDFIHFTANNGLPNSSILAIYEDWENNIWLGTDGNGVLKFTGESFVSYTTKDGLSSNFIMSIAEDQRGNIWLGTYGGGVLMYDGESFQHFDQEKSGLLGNTVWSIIIDKKDNVWIASDPGVSKMDKNGNIVNYEPTDRFSIGSSNEILSNRVRALHEDREGNIWIGSFYGLSKYNGVNMENFSDGAGFLGKEIRSIAEDNMGNLWFGANNGLYQFDGNRFISFDQGDQAFREQVHCIAIDHKETFWLGTENGLWSYTGNKFEQIKVDDISTANFINFLVLDKDHNLWVGTNHGLYELNTSKYYEIGEAQFNRYSSQDGVNHLETNLNAAFKDSDNNLWFGTGGGLVKYSPDKQNLDADHLPIVHINDIRLFLESTDWSNHADSLAPRSGLPINLRVDYKKNHLTFDYIGIDYSNPEEVTYQYKLEGFDEDWLPETKATFATYSNLPHGEFTFMVKAANKKGEWSKPTTLSFEITPPFWVTWWFYSLCALVVLSISYAIYRWRTDVIRRNKRTQQLVYKSKMMALEQQTLNASMNRHFIFNALNSIQYYINRQDKLSANKYLTSFAKLIRKNLDSSQKNLISLEEELERLKLYLSLEHMRFKNKFTYEISIDKELDTETIRIPAMLIQPYIENSIWHGILPKQELGNIKIDVKSNREKGLVFSIEDDGIGINTSIRNKGKNVEEHNSHGVKITNGRINLLRKMTNRNIYVNGPYELKDGENRAAGTKVEIVLPLDDPQMQ